MKLNILYNFKSGPWGGGNQFLKALRKEFSRQGVYEENAERARVILLNSHHNLEDCLALKRSYPSKIVIFRLDGPIFLIRGRDRQLDKIIALFNKLLVDGIVFQSKWSKEKNRELYGISSRYELVIYNAPDNEILNRIGEKDFNSDEKIRLIATSWSSNWRKGFEIYRYLDGNLDFSRYDMTFVGNSPIEFKNVKWIKPVPSEKLAEIVKQNDIYITASQNDPCSNSLLEALASGIPAVALNEGGHPELVQEGGELFNGEKDVIEKIEKVAQAYHYYQSKIPEFSIKTAAQQYYEFVKKICEDVENAKYQPKELNLSTKTNFYKMKFMILKWKGLNNIRAAKNVMPRMKSNLQYYFWATYRRKILDKLLEKNKSYYTGIVLDIGGRDRGRFRKPKDRLDKWIFADIEKKHDPDIVLDIANMSKIRTESIDVIDAVEIFEHVEEPERALRECHRVLQGDGVMILSSPFLYPVHADPYDFQRWTEEKWKKELETLGFKIEQIEIMGRYFTVLADTIKAFIKSMPRVLRWYLFMSYPLLDLLAKFDKLELVRAHPKLGKFHGGYFIVLKK